MTSICNLNSSANYSKFHPWLLLAMTTWLIVFYPSRAHAKLRLGSHARTRTSNCMSCKARIEIERHSVGFSSSPGRSLIGPAVREGCREKNSQWDAWVEVKEFLFTYR